MKAKIGDHYATRRKPLYKIVPLDTPLSVSIEPTTYCNLKCNFCIHSLHKNEILKSGHVFGQMNADTFDLIVSQLEDFPRPVKSFAFIGNGEPLLHRELPSMIEKIKGNRLAENVIIVTNGILLTHELSKNLLSAGVDTIKISINGLSAADYKKNCGAFIDWDQFLSEIFFLYENKKHARVLIKTLSSVLGDRDKEVFYQIFGDCCDLISIEKTMPYFNEINYERLVDNDPPTSRYESVKEKVNICAAPFMRMGIRFDGKVVICGCRAGISTKDMDIRINTLADIWNGQQHKQILLNVLDQEYSGITDYCNQCATRNDFAFKEDNLDPYRDVVCEKVQKGMRTNE